MLVQRCELYNYFGGVKQTFLFPKKNHCTAENDHPIKICTSKIIENISRYN